MRSFARRALIGALAITVLSTFELDGSRGRAVAQLSNDEYEPLRFTDSAGSVMQYRLFAPKTIETGRRYPLVVFLHGRGRKGDDNVAQLNTPGARVWARPENQATHPCFVLAPQCPPNDGWSRPEGMEGFPERTVMATLLELIDATMVARPIDERHVYITGQSGGGGGAMAALDARPQLFAAAAMVCPAGRHTTEEMRAFAERLKRVPVWIFHGIDDPVVPVERSRQLRDAFKKAGASVRYTEYPDTKHDSWDKAYAEPELVDWMFSHDRATVDRDGAKTK